MFRSVQSESAGVYLCPSAQQFCTKVFDMSTTHHHAFVALTRPRCLYHPLYSSAKRGDRVGGGRNQETG